MTHYVPLPPLRRPEPGIRDAVATALAEGVSSGLRIHPGAPREEDLVLGLLTSGVRSLRTNLSVALRSTRLRVNVGGVFCHGTPKVKLSAGPQAGESCELADLLIVTRYASPAHVMRRALLLQFKRTTSRHKATPTQRALYETWPRFEYVITKGLSGPARSVGGLPVPHAGARFADIGPCAICSRWHQIQQETYWRPAPAPRLALVDEITDMILGAAGRSFTLPAPAGSAGWSRIIEDLLGVTAQRAVKLAGRIRNVPAGVGRDALSLLLAERCMVTFAGPAPHDLGRFLPPRQRPDLEAVLGVEGPPGQFDMPEALADDDDDRAVSTLYIEVSPEQ
jgi:hypothetical protein